jgi:hypothetical protein
MRTSSAPLGASDLEEAKSSYAVAEGTASLHLRAPEPKRPTTDYFRRGTYE